MVGRSKFDRYIEYAVIAAIAGAICFVGGLILLAIFWGLYWLNPILPVVGVVLLLIGASVGIYIVYKEENA